MHNKLILFLFWMISFNVITISCQNKVNDIVMSFKDTDAYELAKSIESDNLEKIERLVKKDPALLAISNFENGYNVLLLCIDVERYEAFKLLLDLGADPNYINPNTKYSALMYSIRYFGSSFEWRVDHRFAKALLAYGADPNYAVKADFENKKGRHVIANSPLMNAAEIDLEIVKILIESGADPNLKIGEQDLTPFWQALQRSKFDIARFFIDTIGIDLIEPVSVQGKDSLFIQDYVMTSQLLNKIIEENEGKKADPISDMSRWEFIKYLQSKGVNFLSYDYKRF